MFKVNENKIPMVSVTIPTYNEENSLPFALEAVKNQNYPKLEVIVIDSNSKDNTKKIASQFGAKVINYDGKLLGARYIGVKESKGDYILLLDADQVLKKDSIQRAVNKIVGYDMLIFEEDSYKPLTFIQKKLSEERRIAHNEINSLDPLVSGLLPRFFKKNLLMSAFEKIPKNLYEIVVSGDHAIIYFEAYKISKKIDILNDAVSHIEPESLKELLTHFYRFGKSSKNLAKTGYYNELFKNKTNIKKNTIKALKNENLIIAFLQTLFYRIGYNFG